MVLSRRFAELAWMVGVVMTSASSKGIPGTKMTKSGYDNEFSYDPICWMSRSARQDASIADDDMTAFPNPLVAGFTLIGQVNLLVECPPLVNLTVEVPVPFEQGTRPRTKTWYDYRVKGSFDVTRLMPDMVLNVISDEGPRLAVQVLLCDVRNIGFCSPFVHEQANEREGGAVHVAPGDRHGGSHVHSPYLFVENATSFDVLVPTLVNDPADYFVIAALQFFTQANVNMTGAPIYRFDVANAIEMRVLHYQDPPIILRVRPVVEWIVTSICMVAGFVLLFFLYQTIKHRKNRVLTLSQVDFLILSLVAGLWSVCSAVLLNPRNNLYCNLYSPMILISAQLLYAVTIGRLWRIEKVVSPLLRTGKRPYLVRVLDAVLTGATRCHRKDDDDKIRSTVSHAQMAGVVALLMAPQILLQILAYCLQPKEATIEFNDDESMGRVVCVSHHAGRFQTLTNYAFGLLVLSNILLLVSAQSCKNLPSLFNEMEIIHASTFDGVIVMVLGAGVIAMTSATNPEVDFFVWVSVVLSMSLNATVRIVLPKLRMIWRGETVLVSRLVTDHRLSREMSSRPPRLLRNVSGFMPSVVNEEEGGSSALAMTLSRSLSREPKKTDDQFRAQLRNESLVSGLTVDTNADDQDEDVITIRDDRAPSRKVVVPMLKLQRALVAVNQHITAGTNVPHEEWTSLRSLNANLAATFSRGIKFQWENNRESFP